MSTTITALGKWAAVLLAVAGMVWGLSAAALARGAGAPSATLYVVPHADDEFQFWSVFDEEATDYKILAVLTRGEQTSFCERDSWTASLQEDLGEVRPSPEPDGRWTRECEEARVGSLLGYLGQMSESDPRVPGDFAEPVTYGPLDGGDQELCRMDGDEPNCGDEIREVEVWLDRQNRGAVVQFNLGDGDLTQDRVEWALKALKKHREKWGLAPDVEAGAIVGSFANDGSQRCFEYPHPDHVAVHDALWNVNFKMGPQLGATCTLDPRQSLTRVVSDEASRAAFDLGPDGVRRGAHERHYGWLHAATYPLAFRDEELFHRVQSFWVRLN